MSSDGIVRAVLVGIIPSVIGALAALFVERAWKRHKAKQNKDADPK